MRGSWLLGILLLGTGCAGTIAPAVTGLPADVDQAPLSAVWVGHATVLLRIGSQRIVTDPNLNGTLIILPRDTPASLTPEELPQIDAAVISHLHFDHFDRWTLDQLPEDVPVAFPAHSEPYTTNLGRPKAFLGAWERVRVGGLTITAVPVAHFGGRYLLDALWNRSYTGYVIQGYGRTVFFAGDTGYDPALFKEIGRRFKNIDLALIPIAPYRGDSGSAVHTDPAEALQVFADVGAKHMLPIHYEAYYGFFGRYSEPREKLERLLVERSLQPKVHAIRPGQRLVLPRRAAPYVMGDSQVALRINR